MVHSLDDLNNFIKENDLRKKKWPSTKIEYVCSQCGVITTLSIMQFKRKFANAAVLCDSCRKATFDKSKYNYHHWTEEEKQKANETRKKTCLEKYGVEFTGQLDSVKQAVSNAALNRTDEERNSISEKRKQTNIEKYGVENPIQNEEIKKRIEETCLKKYGTTNPAASEEIKEKIRNVFQEKYGMNPLSTIEVREKMLSTIEERYGTKIISKNKEIRKRIQKSVKKIFDENKDIILAQTLNTNLQKYNTYWPSQTENVKEKVRETIRQRYGVDYVSQIKEVAEHISNKLMGYGEAAFLKNCEDNFLKPIDFKYEGYYDNGPIYYKCECLKCHNVVEIAPHNKNFKCIHCFGKNAISSFKEKEVVQYLKSIYDGEIIENCRRLISPLEVDIYLPEKKLAIEFNGDFWHNEFSKDINYHKEKTQLCEQKGVKLFHIYEYEWLKSKDKVKDIFKSFVCSDKKKVYARQCTIKEISNFQAKEFADLYHLQGHSPAKVYLGLFFNGELVEIETFGHPRFNKNYQWEIVRECSKTDVSVVGGKSKLFSYFISHYSPTNIISYCDASKFSGESYLKCGMRFASWNSPGYVWIKQHSVLTRYQCQKHKLVKQFPELKNSSETEIMHSLGYSKMFDCGQKVYVWDREV